MNLKNILLSKRSQIRAQTMRFNFYTTLKKAKLIYIFRKQISICLGLEVGEGNCKGTQEIFRGGGNVLYFEYGGSYTDTHFYQNSLTHTFATSTFHCMQIMNQQSR